MEQRTDEWYLARKGKMTASEIFQVLSSARSKSGASPFSGTATTWLNHKVAERFMPAAAFLEDMELRQMKGAAIRHGETFEAEARNKYAEKMGYEVYEVGFIDMPGNEDFCGGSPDGMIREEEGIIEIKCPFNGEVHQDYLMMETPDELKSYNLQYYSQMQYNMMVTETKFCDFISYDPRTDEDLCMKVLRIPYDKEFCDNLSERIEMAKTYIVERMNAINNSKTTVL